MSHSVCGLSSRTNFFALANVICQAFQISVLGAVCLSSLGSFPVELAICVSKICKLVFFCIYVNFTLNWTQSLTYSRWAGCHWAKALALGFFGATNVYPQEMCIGVSECRWKWNLFTERSRRRMGRKGMWTQRPRTSFLALWGNTLWLLVNKLLGSLSNDKCLTLNSCNKCYKANFLGDHHIWSLGA